ncbi:hypothetical protein HDU99_001662 [Rhizoclosmatium hyalinum]|nr:hypothetical protein HDU99_001662 [Rhizoclosmatium hyalinum]
MTTLIDVLTSLSLNEGYVNMNPAASNMLICSFFVILTFGMGTYTGNYSSVDRLWSITPVIYTVNYLIVYIVRGYALNSRLLCMALLVSSWGVRLTFNFWRKGGYSLSEETAFDVAVSGIGNVDWQLLDSIAACLFVVLLVIETVADQQQWNFQEKKWGMIKAGKKVENLPAPYNLGFLTSGLFAYSRHPNFFAEFSMWWTLCLFAVSASGDWTNYEALLGAALLNLLFLGSTVFTEYITAQKYPLYKLYQKRVSMLIPWFPLQGELVKSKGKKL